MKYVMGTFIFCRKRIHTVTKVKKKMNYSKKNIDKSGKPHQKFNLFS